MGRWIARHGAAAGFSLVLALAALVAPSAALASPAVTAISPNNGPASGGTMVTITGTGFSSGATVKFGETASTYVVYSSSTKILARSPAGTGDTLVDIRVTVEGATSPVAPVDQFVYDAAPTSQWLGINSNSGNPSGYKFENHNIVYDRSWQLDAYAGSFPTEGSWLGEGLAHSLARGMKPIVTLEYSGTGIPTGVAKNEYVSNFIATVVAVREKYPSSQIWFEPMNEPWFSEYATGMPERYANLIKPLLEEAKNKSIPLNTIFVGAWGSRHGEDWIPGMYAAQPELKTLVKGWYFHPYGRPGIGANPDFNGILAVNSGIMSIPAVQAKMTSGQNNIIVSEIGFWTPDVRSGGYRPSPEDPYVETENSTQAASYLQQTLDEARVMHQEGWLKALLVYSREAGGWAMVNPGGETTAQGQVLSEFGDSAVKAPSFELAAGSLGSEPGQFGKPNYVATDSSGNVWATDPAHSRIEEFSSSGTYIKEIATGSGTGQIAVRSSGSGSIIYVLNTTSIQVKEYDASSGALLGTIGSSSTMTSPSGLAVDSAGDVWVSDLSKKAILEFNSSGTLIRTISAEAAPEALTAPGQLALAAGALYVTDLGNYSRVRIVKFSWEGKYLGEMGPNAWSYEPYTGAAGLAVNPGTGNVYASVGNKVMMFSPEGSYLTSFGSSGSGNGQFTSPRGLAFGPSERLWIADSNNSRIQKWAP